MSAADHCLLSSKCRQIGERGGFIEGPSCSEFSINDEGSGIGCLSSESEKGEPDKSVHLRYPSPTATLSTSPYVGNPLPDCSLKR